MYGQGNYAPQFRHALPTPPPPFQQGLPPPPPPPFPQGSPIPPPAPPVIQQGPSVLSSHVVHSGPLPPPPPAGAAIYQHGSPLPPPPPSVPQGGPPPPPSIQQGPPVRIPPPGLVNIGLTYLHSSPVVHGSSQMALSYPPPQQNSQYPSYIMNQNMHHDHTQLSIPPPPGPIHQDMIRAPLPPRILPPPPPSQGHMSFSNPLQLPHGFQHVRPQHAPPPSSFVPVTPASFAFSEYGAVENAHPPPLPPPPPPPPPSSPPPVPPSPPPSTSPLRPGLSARCSESPSAIPLVAASYLSRHSNSDLGCSGLSDSEKMDTDSVDKAIGTAQATDDVPEHGNHPNTEGGTNCQMESLVEGQSPYQASRSLVIPSPPPKPVEEKIVQKIELLCQFIAKNGHDFENMAREKESENPEFAFLFGGELGSEAAIAHEYFLWMRKKCCMESKLHDGSEQIDSSSRSWEIESLMQPSTLIAADVSCSPADSDMDMEDDVIQPDKDQQFGEMIECLNSKPASICNEGQVMKEHLQKPKSSLKHSPAKDVLPDIVSCSGSHGQAEQEKHKKDFSPFLEDLGPVTVSPAAAGIGHIKAPDPFTSGGSPFRLIQDYASDDSAEDDDGPCLEHTSPVNISPLTAKSSQEDKGIDLDVNLASNGVSGAEKGFEPLIGSVSVSSIICMPDVSREARGVAEAIVLGSDAVHITDELVHDYRGNQTFNSQSASHEASRGSGVLQGDVVDIGSSNGKVQKKDAKQAPILKVDEFGRLLREDASDSDSDELYRIGRRGKRGRSWSRSQSPHDRRKRSRSPWRRKEKRSRSRSWSPRKRKSRSKSPAFRRMGESGTEKMRRDRGQIPDCFDFLRGRCYRGASCRYLHHDPMSDGPRRYRSKQQYPEDRHDSRDSIVREEIENIPAKISTHEQNDVKRQEMQPCPELSARGIDAPEDGFLDEKKELDSVRDDVQPIISSEVTQSLVTVTGEIDHPEISGEAVQVWQTQQVQDMQEESTAHLLEQENFQQSIETHLPCSQPAIDADKPNSQGETSSCIPSSGENSVAQQSEAVSSVLLTFPGVQNADQHPQQVKSPPQVKSSLISHSSPDETLPTSNQISMSEPYPNKASLTQLPPDATSLSQPPQSESFVPRSQATQDLHQVSFPVGDVPFQPSQLPPPPPFRQGMNAPHVLQPPTEFNVAPVITTIQFHCTGAERLPPYQATLHNQHSFPPPPSYFSELTSSSIDAPGFSYSQSQPNPIPPRTDLPLPPPMRPYPSEQAIHSRFTESQPRTYLPMEEPHRPPLQMEDFRIRPLPMGNQLDQPFGGLSFVRDDQFTHSIRIGGNQFHHMPQQDYRLHTQPVMREEHRLPLPIRDEVQNGQPLQNQRLTYPFSGQSLAPSSSYTMDNMLSQAATFQRELPAKQIQSLRTDNLPLREDYIASGNLSSQHHQQQLSYGLQRSAADNFSVHLGGSEKVDSSISGYSSNFSNQLPHLPDALVSRISGSTHYNPFASTFDQPPGSSKFSSNALRQEIDKSYSSKYGSPFGLTHVPVDAALGSKHIASFPDSSRFVEQIIPRSGSLSLSAPSGEMNNSRNPREPSVEGFPGSKYQSARQPTAGDQYDPLFDSIEPSSNAFRIFSRVQEQDSTSTFNKSVAARAANETEDTLRLNGSQRLLDVEENNKQKISMVAAVSKSSENDEFGETAVDAEAGDVENESPINPIDMANTGTGEIEIDQVQAPGKSKKRKDSRSMRLFKVAIADFVKEVLKPSWRQGNMSKEAFKTIVKKTVDKVSGAMKNNQVPKSQAKINQYVESSQRKLTKLVMGYVDKYVKV